MVSVARGGQSQTGVTGDGWRVTGGGWRVTGDEELPPPYFSKLAFHIAREFVNFHAGLILSIKNTFSKGGSHMSSKVRIAIVGLGFGSEFIPIWQNHPDAEMYAICQRTQKTLDQVGDAFKVNVRYTDFDELIRDPNVDAVHINSPIPDHAWMSIAALKAGKHVACTVPMATSTDDCKRICDAQKKSRKVYMMMETVVYSREFLYVKDLVDSGKLGRIQFLRGCHQQDMAGWPGYWEGLPRSPWSVSAPEKSPTS
jgi:hypothetical protein